MVDAPPPPAPPHAPAKIDRAALLASLYQYLSARLESLTRRCSMLMAFLGSYLGFITSSLVHDGTTSSLGKLHYALTHPSVLVGLVGVGVLAWSEVAHIKRSDDLFAQLAFSDVNLQTLQSTYTNSPIDSLFDNMMANIRVVGGFVRRKVRLYNSGCVLFAASVALYVVGF